MDQQYSEALNQLKKIKGVNIKQNLFQSLKTSLIEIINNPIDTILDILDVSFEYEETKTDKYIAMCELPPPV